MLHDRTEDFNRTSFPTTELLAEQLLQQQGQSLINLLYAISQNEFVNILRMNRDWVHTNNLVAGIQPPITFGINVINDTNVQTLISHTFLNTSTSSCSCYDDPTCVSPVTFYTLSSITRQYPNPELYYGCHIVEAALKSNLAFLYDQNWIDEIRQLIQFDLNNPANLNTSTLNASSPSQFNITTSLSIIVDQMMTEPWYTNVNYTAYYEECRPIECRYTYVIKYDTIYIVTTVIGLIGGVVTILQLVILVIVRFVRRRRRNTIDVASK